MINKSNSASFNAESVTAKMLKTLKVKFSHGALRKKMQSNPNYPSVLAIMDVLTEWNLGCQVYNLDKEDFNQGEMPFPLIVHTTQGKGRFMLIHGFNEKTFVYSDESKNRASIAASEFFSVWDGVTLFAERTAQSGDPEYANNKISYGLKKLNIPTSILLALIAVCYSLGSNSANLLTVFLVLIKSIGLAVGIMLLLHSVNANNPFVRSLCSLGGENNCSAILKSKASKVTSWLSWSEVGFFYFAGSLLSVLLAPGATFSLTIFLLGVLNLLSLPYTIYSITYQYRNKQWCVLCLTTQAVLWIEFLIFFNTGFYTLGDIGNYSFMQIAYFSMSIVFSFSAPVVIWGFLFTLLNKASGANQVTKQLNRFKYNSALFKKVLESQPYHEVGEVLKPIVIGDKDAKHSITIVSNPNCDPCSLAHNKLETIVKKRQDIRVEVIFTTPNDNEDLRTRVALHLSAINFIQGNQSAATALNSWYQNEEKDFLKWTELNPAEVNEEVSSVTTKQRNWCESIDIAYTPTIFINGYKIPEPYQLEDIEHLLS